LRRQCGRRRTMRMLRTVRQRPAAYSYGTARDSHPLPLK
jgi:hypothetical protein